MTAKKDRSPRPPEGADPPAPSRRGLLFVALGLLAAGLVVALVAVIHRPDYVVLVRMDDAEEGWFRTRLSTFEEQHRVRLTTRTYKDGDELERLLRAETLDRKRRVLLAMVPQSMLTPLVEEDLVRSLEDLRGRARARELLAAMAPEAAAPATVRGEAYYVPGSIATPLLFWSKRRVADAVEHWESERPRIAAALARENGSGLPRGYRLEPDPAEWDTYDVAVAAAYWASRPFDGLTVPRVAHPAAGEAAALDLATRALSQGAGAEELLSLDGVALRDALAWESLFFRQGWYHPSMAAESWEPRDLLTAAAQGQLFLGWLDASHLFRLHGTGAAGLEGFLRDPADLGVSRVPRGVSLELERGSVARAGDPRAARSGDWWAVPRTAPEPTLAWELAEHLASIEFQKDRARAFGALPARRDLLSGIDLVFDADWMFAIGRVAKRQALDSGRPLPAAPRWRRVEAGLVAAWREACVEERTTDALELGLTLKRAVDVAQGPAPAPPVVGAADSARARGD